MSKILIDRDVVEQALEAMLKAGEQRGSTYTEFNAIEALRAALEKPQVEQEPVAWQSIEAMAAQRYKVVPSHDSMFYRHAVVAGDGTQQLYIGRETECENMTRKFAGAFLDGAYVASLYTHPQPPRQPLTEEEIRDLFQDQRAFPRLLKFIRVIEAAHGIGEPQ